MESYNIWPFVPDFFHLATCFWGSPIWGICSFKMPTDSDANHLTTSYLLLSLSLPLPLSLSLTLFSYWYSLKLCFDLNPWASVHTICLGRKSHVLPTETPTMPLLSHTWFYFLTCFISPLRLSSCISSSLQGVGGFSLYPTSIMISSTGFGEERMILSPSSTTH